MDFDFKEIACPVCGERDATFLGFRGGEAHQNGVGVKTSIVRCHSCTHQYPNPMPFPKVSLEEMYVDPIEYFRGHDIEAKKYNGLSLIREFEQKMGRKGRFLDVGCGAGELLWAAKKSGWEADGIDPSRDFIAMGKEKLGVEGRVATLEDARFPSDHFDAVVMGGIIEHLYDPIRTLREIHRVMRRDGWLYFDAPNEDGLYMKLGNLYMKMLGRDWLVTLAPTFPPYHVQGFNPGSVVKLLERSDFRAAELVIFGDISSQTGSPTLRKKIEHTSAKLINWFGKIIGRGMYMGIWAQKKS
ncbi:MAG: class I SAM-dependent methyltransferase [Pyrinomonadaceae bacterium]